MKRCTVLCLCLAVCSIFAGCSSSNAPDPAPVQVVDPIVEVASPAEMADMLDFPVPVLDKAIDRCTVLVFDSLPTMGRLYYADGGVFSIQYGTGDISGIYGGACQREAEIGGVSVAFYTYEDTCYALWETGGFTHSLTGGSELESEVAALIG